MKLTYQRSLPYPLDRMAAQYFDLEHVKHVHSRTLGQFRLLSVSGRLVRSEYRLPHPWGWFLKSMIDQDWAPPNHIRYTVTSGFFKGTQGVTRITPSGNHTLVREEFHFRFPNFGLLRLAAQNMFTRLNDRVWEEDLKAGMPHGG